MKERVAKQKKVKKRTVSSQLTLIFVGLMAGVIVSCFLINSLFLEKYYIYKKQEALTNSYKKIAELQNQGITDKEAFATALNGLALRYNISICVLDSESKTKYASSNGGENLDIRLIGYTYGLSAPRAKIIEAAEDYVLQRTTEKNQEFLELYGTLDDGVDFILQTTIESIHETAKMGMTFFAIIGLIGIVVGAVIIASVTRRITRPLRELNELSSRMVNLDFNAKYRGHASNEIGTLGENMNHMSASLEKTISELMTANNELQKDIEKKEQIDAMRREFLGNVSHELKTPIALIQGYAEGLQDNVAEDPDSVRYYCDVIVDEAGKMNHLVKQLMSLNQLESGNDIVTMERFNLSELIGSCIEHEKLLAQEKKIKVLFQRSSDCYAWGDEFKVEEVFTNYFSNAVHHCEGENIIEVKLIEKDGCVRVSVFNTGKPIPEESLPYVWDKFYKVDKARTREYGGSGVGLSIVKAIMNSMNQNFGVENHENGVVFWFELETKNVV